MEDLRTTMEEEDMMEGKKPFVPIVLCSQQRFVLLFKKKSTKWPNISTLCVYASSG